MIIALDHRCRRLLVAGLAASLLITGVTAAQDEAKAPATADLPDSKEVFENAMKALGGREALDNIKSSMVKAKMTTPMGELTLESFFASPDRFLLKQGVPGMGEMSMGSDGETTWVMNPMMGGYQLIEEEDAADIRDQASMHNIVVRLEKEFTDAATIDRLQFNNQDCYKVRMLDKEGVEQFAYFNAEDHLMAGLEMKQNTPQGPTTSVMRFEDWKKHGNIKMFKRMIVNQMGMNMTMNVTEVEFDKVDEAVFVLPEEVKKLAADKKANDASGDDDDASEESAS